MFFFILYRDKVSTLNFTRHLVMKTKQTLHLVFILLVFMKNELFVYMYVLSNIIVRNVAWPLVLCL